MRVNSINIGFRKRKRRKDSFSWSSYWKSRSLFFLDGTISGDTFLDISGNDRHFTITGKDFADDWTTGLPYKSAATISAPVGDAVLIAADINNFLYDAGGTPNAIPVVSLFQNIDYENKIFCKHEAQVLDDNGVETYEPRVINIFMVNGTLSAADLVKANTYFGVPTDAHSSGYLVAKTGGDYTTVLDAAAAAPSGSVIYVKTGEYDDGMIDVVDKILTIKGIGFVKCVNGSGYPVRLSNASAQVDTLIGIWLSGSSGSLSMIDSDPSVSMKRCKLDGQIYDTTETTYSEFINCIIGEGTYTVYGATVKYDTNLIIKKSVVAFNVKTTLNFSNNKILGSYSSGLISPKANCTLNFLGDTIYERLLVDAFVAYSTNISLNYCKLVSTATIGVNITIENRTGAGDISITNCEIDGLLKAVNITLYNQNDITFSNNTHIGKYLSLGFDANRDVDKDVIIEDNVLITSEYITISIIDYTAIVNNNIMIADDYARVGPTAVNVSSCPVTISNNYMVGKGATEQAAFVRLGTENSLTIDDYLVGSKVYNNRFSGPADWGNDPVSLHALFTWSQSAEWYNNYLSGSFLGFVFKSNGGTHVNKVHHNLVKDCSMSYTIKGNQGDLIYNNVHYNAGGFNALSEVYVGCEGDAGDYTLKNNIFYKEGTGRHLIIEDADDILGATFDHNLYYNPSQIGGGVAELDSTDYTLAEWKLEGYDINSVEQDPVLSSGLIPATPIEIGEDLGEDYDDGLDASTDWGSDTELPNVVTKQQGAAWDIGAYV